MVVYENETPAALREPGGPAGQGRQGYLRINVAAARRAIPVYRARIAVYSAGSGREQDLLALLETDESGSAEVISLPAPQLAGSLEPGQDSPYYTYYMRVAAASFVTQDKIPVQIFPGVESSLVVNLQTPLYSG